MNKQVLRILEIYVCLYVTNGLGFQERFYE